MFDSVKKEVTKAVAKTGDMAEISLTYLQKTKLKGKLETLYSRLGKVYFLHATGEPCEETVFAIVAEIKTLKAQYKEACAKIEEGVDEFFTNYCFDCGSKLGRGMKYCYRCGNQVG
jgi:rRNA maturation endonuclease Nob1